MKNIDRRKFIKISGAAAVTTTMASCAGENGTANGEVDYMGHHEGEVPNDISSHRT